MIMENEFINNCGDLQEWLNSKYICRDLYYSNLVYIQNIYESESRLYVLNGQTIGMIGLTIK